MFGCVAYTKVAHPHLAKLDPRGLKVVFIGYEPGSKMYRLYDPVGGELTCLATSSSMKARCKCYCGKKMRVLRTDRGREFTSASFGKYCDELDMQQQLTAPYSPLQNGVVECQNQTIIGITMSLLMTIGMPERFWGEAVMMAVYLLNRSPMQSLDWKMPHEAWYNKKPAVHHLREP